MRDGHTKALEDKMDSFEEIKNVLGLSDYLGLDKDLK